jgi:hypothetical protein
MLAWYEAVRPESNFKVWKGRLQREIPWQPRRANPARGGGLRITLCFGSRSHSVERRIERTGALDIRAQRSLPRVRHILVPAWS